MDICIFFLPYSGGKFIANCLGISKEILLNHKESVSWDLSQTVFDHTYYQEKFKAACKSFNPDFKNSGQWMEFGDPVPVSNPRNRKQCYIAHFNDELDEIKKKHDIGFVCRLVNYEKFNSLAFWLKSPTPDLERHSNGYEHWNETCTSSDFDFDVDSIWSSAAFLKEMEDLYAEIGLPDFSEEIISRLHRKYMQLHGIDI